jgi:hypothetical protein
MKPGFFLYFSFLFAKLVETGLLAAMRIINSGNTGIMGSGPLGVVPGEM